MVERRAFLKERAGEGEVFHKEICPDENHEAIEFFGQGRIYDHDAAINETWA